jgi:hypothetical protein
MPEGYRVQMWNGAWYPDEGMIPPQDMIHWRGWNAEDPKIGISRLETLRAVIAEEAAVQQALVELVKSGLAEPSWVWRDMNAPEWSAEARERFEEDLSNRLRWSGTKPPVLEEGMELRGFGVSPRNAQMLEVRKYALQQVASLFGVPLGMVGLAPDVAEAQSEFYADTLPPIAEQFCRQLNLSVLQIEYEDTELYFEFDLDEKLMGDERLKALTSAAGVPPMTRNEARARLNLPPVEGGDEPITPLNVIAGDNPKPSPQIMPIQDPNKPEQDGSGSNEEKAIEPELIEAVLTSLFERQRKAKKSSGNWKRWDRELTKDLATVGFDDEDAEKFAREINETTRKGLLTGDEVWAESRIQDLAVKAVWLAANEHPSIRNDEKLERLRLLRDLGLPKEVLWEMAGFNEEEIDRMRAIEHSQELLAAARNGHAEPADH